MRMVRVHEELREARIDPDVAATVARIAAELGDAYSRRATLRQPDDAQPRRLRRTEYTRYLERSRENLRALGLH